MRVLPVARATVIGIGVVIATSVLAACSGQSSAGPTTASPMGSPMSSAGLASTPSLTATGPSAGATVRLLTHDSFALSEQTIADFTAATGWNLEVITAGDAGTMVAGAILAAGQPTADVMFGVDNTLATKAIDAGVFEPYASTQLDALEPALVPADNSLTPVDYGDVCINIDAGWFDQAGIAPPTTLADLADPKYRDLLVVQDPATSSPGLAFLLGTISRYPDTWTDYWASLRDNGVKVAGSWSDAYLGDFTAGGGGGDRPLVVSYATSPPAEIVYAAEPKPTRPSTSVMTDGCYRQVEYAGVLAGTSNPAGAQAVIDWLASAQVQQDVPLNMFVFPARTGTPLPQVFTDFAAVVDHPLQLPADEVAAQLPDWLDSWGTVMDR